jgi:EmrB/QacA subfamily drug resistance transporter
VKEESVLGVGSGRHGGTADFPTPERERRVRRAALVVATLTSFLGPFMGSSVNVALPSLGREFGMTPVGLGWVNMAFLISAAAFAIPFGRLGDIFGRRRLYGAGVVVFTLASALIAVAPSGALVIAGRAVQGFGSSMIFATGMAILISVYPPQQRGRVLGLNVAAVYFGLSSGPFVGGLITGSLGWRFIFALNVPVGLFLVALIAFVLQGEWADAAGARFDWGGAAALSASLALTVFGFARLPGAGAMALVAVGLAGMAGFAVYETRRRDPLLDIALFRHNRVFAFSSLAALINYAATFAVTFLLSLYLQDVRGLSPEQAGLVLVVQPLVQALLSPWAGRLSDRVEPRTVASIGMGLCFVGVGLLNLVGRDTSFVGVIACLVFLGIGFALFSSPNTKAIMSAVEPPVYGVASAVVGTMRQVGMTLSMAAVMVILHAHLGDAEVDAGSAGAFVAAMRTAFSIFAGLCAVGILASLARGPASPDAAG